MRNKRITYAQVQVLWVQCAISGASEYLIQHDIEQCLVVHQVSECNAQEVRVDLKLLIAVRAESSHAHTLQHVLRGVSEHEH
jgi:hypothetical protein